jgi:hypothetical protein
MMLELIGGCFHLISILIIILRMIKSRRTRWAVHVVRLAKNRNAYGILVESQRGKRPLGRLKRGRVDYIKMDLR